MTTSSISHINILFDAEEFSVAKQDRMFVYIWENQDEREASRRQRKPLCKFGEHWVPQGICPVASCARRVYNSLGQRKDYANVMAKIDLVWIFDATKVAKVERRFKKNGKIDDVIREKVGHRLDSTGEVHTLSGHDMKIKVANILNQYGAELVKVGLSTKQRQIADEIISEFNSRKRIVLADLCPRFGKTIWSAAVAVEMEVPLVIIASYVKTVSVSFKSDLAAYKQFSSVVYIDSSDADYKERIKSALKNRRQLFVYLSLNQGEMRQERIDFLFSLKAKRMLIIDEADFGSYKKAQAIPLAKKTTEDKTCKVIVMTGTNADRAARYWEVDKTLSVTYPELLVQKRETQNA